MTETTDAPAAPAVLDQRTAAFVLAVLDVVAKGSADTLREARTIAARDYFTQGDRLTVRDLDTGEKLGTVSMSDPDPKAEIVDRDAFVAHMAATFPAVVDEVTVLRDGVENDAMDVLREHAPHLLETRQQVTVQGEKAALELATRPDSDPIPGVEVRWPRGVVSTRLSTDGRALIRARIAAGSVDALRALPAKDGA